MLEIKIMEQFANYSNEAVMYKLMGKIFWTISMRMLRH